MFEREKEKGKSSFSI